MRLLKIIFVFMAIYFIRRFIQMYRVMKQIQEQQLAEQKTAAEESPRPFHAGNVVNAEYKVLD